MSSIKEWPKTAKEVLTHPKAFFQNEERTDGFGYPLKFALISFLILGILKWLTGDYSPFGMNVVASAYIGTIEMVSVIFETVIGTILIFGFVHFIVYLKKGSSGFRSTLAVFEYGTAIMPIYGIISTIPRLEIVSYISLSNIAYLIVNIYTLYIYIQGIKEFQNLSTGRAMFAVLLPVLTFITLSLAFLIWLFSGI